MFLALAVVFAAGCPRSSPDGPVEEFALGDLVEGPFEPPALEALNSQVEWAERPVLDQLQIYREHLAQQPVLATVEEALALRNDSDEANAKIISALGRLPKDPADADFEASITRTTAQQLNNSNPMLASSQTEFEVYSLTAFGLFTFDWNFEPFAMSEYVVSWQTSKDGLYDKVVMRDDLVWSDGHPITAHDVEFSFKVIMSSQVPIRAIRQGTDQLNGVKAYDDHTVVYFHKKPLVTNVWNLNFPIIPKHVYEKSIHEDPTLTDSDYHIALEDEPVVGAQYEVVKRDETEIVLQRRESYYMVGGTQVREKPFFKTVRLRIVPEASVQLLGMKAGDIDEMLLEPSQWSDQTNDDDFYKYNTKARGVEWTTFSFQWNTQSPFFSDSQVRWAMTYAFDHKEMLATLRKGLDEPCTGTFHSESRWYPGGGTAIGAVAEPIVMDRDKAKQLLDEAGWVDTDGDGYRDKEINGRRRKFEFTMLVRNQKERIDICELMAQNLRLVGVDCNVASLESATLQDKMFNKQFDAAYGGWGTGTDPDTSENIWATGKQRNFVSYSNPMVDELFEEGRKIPGDRKLWKELKLWNDEATREYLKIDPALAGERPAREDCYAAIHALLWRDQPYTWLFYRTSYRGFSKKLRGYMFSPRDITGFGPGFSSWWMPADY